MQAEQSHDCIQGKSIRSQARLCHKGLDGSGPVKRKIDVVPIKITTTVGNGPKHLPWRAGFDFELNAPVRGHLSSKAIVSITRYGLYHP
jgi:hypothetical protein